MYLKKIFEGRIDSLSTGAEATIALPARPGGRMCKVAHYDIKTLASSGANVRLSLDLYHSPDGNIASLHSAVLSAVDPGTTPSLISNDADVAKVIGEWLHVRLKIKDVNGAGGAAQWALVEVFELRKPF